MENGELLKKISKDVEHIKGKLDSVSEDVEGLKTIEVKSSGGLSMKLNRSQFMQRMFDKPEKDTVNNMINEAIRTAPIKSFRTISKDIILATGMIAGLLKIFGLI